MQVWETLAGWRKNEAARREEKNLARRDCCPGAGLDQDCGGKEREKGT